MAAKPTLLYVTPVLPALTGNGLAMRAGIVLEALARHYRVTLRVVPRYGSPDERLDPRLAARCSPEPGRLRRRRGYDVAHFFRLAVTDEPARAERRQVDLDEVDSVTHRSLAALHRANGADGSARLLEGMADHFEALERAVLARGDRVYVASAAERSSLSQLAPADVRVLPNAVRLAAPLPARAPSEPFTLLFVGTLGYAANEDAARTLCDEVLPRVGGPVRAVVVGSGGSPALAKLGARPDVELAGQVRDVTPFYEQADAVVVPLRAGGGTRIKILEAFAYGRPVVSTPTGCAGLDVRDGGHLLVGETAEELAEHCRRLIQDPELARALADAASRLVRRSHTIDAVAAALDP